MRRVIGLIGIVTLLWGARLPFGLEGGAGMRFQEGENAFSLYSGVLLKVYRNIYARTTFIELGFSGGKNYLFLGTGDGFDLMLFFPNPGFNIYGFGSLWYIGGGGYSYGYALSNFSVGGGLEFKIIGSPIKPYAEASFSLISGNGSTSLFTIKGGVRVR